MKYYSVAEIDIIERSWIEDYVKNVTRLVERYGGRYLARTANFEKTEGERSAPQLYLIIEWPTRAAADAFYASAEYRPYLASRKNGARTEALLVAGEDINRLARQDDAGKRSGMNDARRLPPGQCELDEFPRFGLRRFANRFPKETHAVALSINGDVTDAVVVAAELADLPRVDQTADFHCVTTWSRRSLRWSGFRFADFYRGIVVPRAQPDANAAFVVLRCQDGYAASLPLGDLLADDVLLADRLNDESLSIAHGAPLRLVAPAHYGYKNAKHLRAIEFWRDDRRYRPTAFPFRFMEHPRARVAPEERGCLLPGWILRYLYRPLVRPTIRQFHYALEQHLRTSVSD